VGYFRLSNYSELNRNIYIGADIDPQYQGQGLGYRAYCEFLPVLFKKYNLHKITLEVLSTNARALNLYKKIGFITEGIKRQEVLKNGQWFDSIIMSILHQEYEKQG
jgi:RimJ/RimL family protein N-acetyltransferase